MAMRQKRMGKMKEHPSTAVKYSIPASFTYVFSVLWKLYRVINNTQLILDLARGLKRWILNTGNLILYFSTWCGDWQSCKMLIHSSSAFQVLRTPGRAARAVGRLERFRVLLLLFSLLLSCLKLTLERQAVISESV